MSIISKPSNLNIEGRLLYEILREIDRLTSVYSSSSGSINNEIVNIQSDIVTINNDISTLDSEKQNITNAAVPLTDAATIDLTAIKHTLTTASATRTFTISYLGDDITIEVVLNNTASVFTFPATSLCVSEGVASGNNILSLSGTSGDRHIIAIKKINTSYFVVCKNFGQ